MDIYEKNLKWKLEYYLKKQFFLKYLYMFNHIPIIMWLDLNIIVSSYSFPHTSSQSDKFMTRVGICYT